MALASLPQDVAAENDRRERALRAEVFGPPTIPSPWRRPLLPVAAASVVDEGFIWPPRWMSPRQRRALVQRAGPSTLITSSRFRSSSAGPSALIFRSALCPELMRPKSLTSTRLFRRHLSTWHQENLVVQCAPACLSVSPSTSSCVPDDFLLRPCYSRSRHLLQNGQA